jgi:hypothetical protein
MNTDNNFIKHYTKVASLWKMTINTNSNEALSAYRSVLQMVQKYQLKVWDKDGDNIPFLLTNKKVSSG